MLVEVLKAFNAEVELHPGDVVDASEWRTLRQLTSQRYVREVREPVTGVKRTPKKEPKNG